ncbi:hypothetical protein SOVF_214550, partial [Spinacia oleracea]
MNMRVSYLIDYENRCWNEERVREVFVEEEQRLVYAIPLSSQWPCDSYYWWPTSNGIYSVKSAYWLGMLGHTRTWELQFGSREADLWSWVWKMEGPPKLRHFLWRACKGTLATMGVLFRRHIRPTMECTVCGALDETIIHALFECKHSQVIWESSEFLDILKDAPTSSFADRLVWAAGKMTQDKLRLFSTLAWAGWCCRNKAVFDCGNTEPIQVAAGFARLVTDYMRYNEMVTQHTSG